MSHQQAVDECVKRALKWAASYHEGGGAPLSVAETVPDTPGRACQTLGGTRYRMPSPRHRMFLPRHMMLMPRHKMLLPRPGMPLTRHKMLLPRRRIFCHVIGCDLNQEARVHNACYQ
jgi:hypothetical protein